MIPIVEKIDDSVAKYTKFYIDTDVSVRTAIENLFSSFDPDNSQGLYDHFIARYRYIEICTENEDRFMKYVIDTYEELKDYYQQVLAGYKHDIDFDNIIKRTSSRTDTSSGRKDGGATNSGTDTHREYDLPNKVINPSDENGYLTSKSTDTRGTSVTTGESHSNTYGSTNVTLDYKDFIGLKREYLAHIRDIYEDFVDEFKDCFLHIY